MGQDFEWAFDILADFFPHCIAEALQNIHYMLKRLVILCLFFVWAFCAAHFLFSLTEAIGGVK